MFDKTIPINAMMLVIFAAMPVSAATLPATRPAAAPAPARVGGSGLPAQDAIRDLFASGDYPKTLVALGRVLVLKGKAAEPYDRHELLQIKGESHIRLKTPAPAAAAFEAAASAAPDAASRAQDVAFMLLMKRVNATMLYQPRLKDPANPTRPQAPVNVVEPETRIEAVKLLFLEELAAFTPRVTALEKTDGLPPLFAIMPALRDVRNLELAATGSTGQTLILSQRILKTAQARTGPALKAMELSTDDINEASNHLDPHRPFIIGNKMDYLWRGPDKPQSATLKETLATCVKLYDVQHELAEMTGSTAPELDAANAFMKRVGTKAKWLLYSVPWGARYCRIEQALESYPWNSGPYSEAAKLKPPPVTLDNNPPRSPDGSPP